MQATPSDEGFVVVQEGRGSVWMRTLTRRVSGRSFVVRSNGAPVASGPVGVVRLSPGPQRIFIAWDDAGWPIEIDVHVGAPTHVEVGFPRGLRLAEGSGRDRLDRSWQQWRRDGRIAARP